MTKVRGEDDDLEVFYLANDADFENLLGPKLPALPS
jgi:hypothetical protein